MKSKLIALMLFCSLASASEPWGETPAIKYPATINLTLSGTSLLPTYYTAFVPGFSSAPIQDAGRGGSVINYAFPGSSTQGILLTGIQLQQYSHLQVTNQTANPLSFSTSPYPTMSQDPTLLPLSSLNGKDKYQKSGKLLIVSAGGQVQWNDISLFDNLFVMSEDGNSVISGTLTVTAW